MEMYEPWYAPWISYPIGLGNTRNKTACIARHERHIKEVLETVPEEQLLHMKITEGWEPLCNFLGLPIPDEPFPRVNSREESLGRRERAIRIATWYPILPLGAILGLVILSSACLRGIRLLKSVLVKKSKVE